MKSHDFFSKIAKQYKAYRPTYPKVLVDKILENTRNREVYVDVACGSGQLTALMAPYFARAVGVDKAGGQIAQAISDELMSRIEFVEGDAHKIPMESESADLLTCAQALHWFLEDNTFSEFGRVLKRGGIFAAISYANPEPTDPQVREAFNHFYFNRLGSHLAPGEPGCAWQCDRRLVDTGYSTVQFPRYLFETISRSQHRVKRTLDRDGFVHYLKTFSALENLKHSGTDPVQEFAEKVKDIPRIEFTTVFNLVLLLRL